MVTSGTALYADGVALGDIPRWADDDRVSGFTTNPSLMRKAGITDYRLFKDAVLGAVNGLPVSFEVLADDWQTMEKQAREIAGWGRNVWVKIPVTNCAGDSSLPLIKDLLDLRLNVTAVMTRRQVDEIAPWLSQRHILSVFCGRIMDTMAMPPGFHYPHAFKALWASPRQVFNITQAANMGYDIITLSPDLLAKLDLLRKSLEQYSVETVQQFYSDGQGISF